MRTLLYSDLDTGAMPGFAKVRRALEAGDFRSADVRKIGPNLYRARLDRRDRLLFSLYRHGGETCILLLEHIPNHDYARSRFLAGGAAVDEAKIPLVEEVRPEAELGYVHPERERFHVLDKVISFDEDQATILGLPAPIVLVGSAGSGKTALTLERLRQAPGDVLYLSLSPWLVDHSRDLYQAHGYENDAQQVDFLSFREYLDSIRVPEGREVTPADFQHFLARKGRGLGLNDAHKVFEEIRGVITGPVAAPGEGGSGGGWLSRDAYLELGVRQSIFLEEERPRVYDVFERYLAFLEEAGLFDPNLVAHAYLDRVEPRYDFVVVDEVQDVTTVQLLLVLKALRAPGAFLLTGDANQIVHPNFFSWAAVKSLLFHDRDLAGHGEIVRVLHANYRSTAVVTAVANRILKLKHARFGSVDRESNYLVRSVGGDDGRLQLLADSERVRKELDARTARSARHAVIVMHPEQKAEARRIFRTPLIFAVQEAKGLEYESVILHGFVSGAARVFRTIAEGVAPADLEGDELGYSRARDKRDKSLEVYKFFVNALYVAVTRAVRNLFIVEADLAHPVLRLLDLERFAGELDMESVASSREEWQREARRLAQQGRTEQADAIREQVLEEHAVPWQPLDRDAFLALRARALEDKADKKLRLEVFEWAQLHHHRPTLNALADAGFRPAQQDPRKAQRVLHRNRYGAHELGTGVVVLRDVDRYGVDHRDRLGLTPLMIAARVGNAKLAEALVERGADPELRAANGFAAWHFALEQALADAAFATQKLPRLQALLEPQSVTIEAAGHGAVKLDRRMMEAQLLHLLIASFWRDFGARYARHGELVTAVWLEKSLASLPPAVLPEYRKRRSYLSSVLSKNEIRGNDPYNRRLLRRLKRGHYVLEPTLRLRIGERWCALHELLPLDDLSFRPMRDWLTPVQSRNQQESYGPRWHTQWDRLQEDNLVSLRRSLHELGAASAPVATGEPTTRATTSASGAE